MPKFLLLQTYFGFLLVVAYFLGYLNIVWQSDPTKLVAIIGIMGLWGLYEGLKEKWEDAIDTGNNCVLLGLIGTVLGIILSLRGISIESIGDIQSVKGLVVHVLGGMGTAYFTTLVGATILVWIRISHKLCR